MKKITLILVIVLWSCHLFGQEIEASGVTLGHIGLSVKDVNKASDFYEQLFGLERIPDANRREGVIWLSLSEGKELHLQTVDKENTLTHMATHFALFVPDFDSFLKNVDKLELKLYSYPSAQSGSVIVRPGGIRKVYIKDLDENWIEVISSK
ncbi:VOC family protein [Fulvivirga lutimaris]|uniref:VOC family protein n=1 Tax=Fulvivirga lutimaris TaxID=1819566 RepID=UPI0012BCA427|nr:VOC family protein [Fulvivirga lutimaris]MTI41974.1 hypothetical protein [Fulvivirga lutimaris]